MCMFGYVATHMGIHMEGGGDVMEVWPPSLHLHTYGGWRGCHGSLATFFNIYTHMEGGGGVMEV